MAKTEEGVEGATKGRQKTSEVTVEVVHRKDMAVGVAIKVVASRTITLTAATRLRNIMAVTGVVDTSRTMIEEDTEEVTVGVIEVDKIITTIKVKTEILATTQAIISKTSSNSRVER